MFNTNIKHFPFSDHDLVSTKLKLDDIERMIDTIISMVVRNILKRIEKLFSITA
jgi:hypothetical protein